MRDSVQRSRLQDSEANSTLPALPRIFRRRNLFFVFDFDPVLVHLLAVF